MAMELRQFFRLELSLRVPSSMGWPVEVEKCKKRMKKKRSSSSTRENFSMIALTAKALSKELTDRLMRACMSKVRRACKVVKSDRMELSTLESSRTIFLTEMASLHMQMVNLVTRETGLSVLCMAEACINGLMAVATKVTINTIRKTGLVSTCGPMDAPTMECGKMATRTARAPK